MINISPNIRAQISIILQRRGKSCVEVEVILLSFNNKILTWCKVAKQAFSFVKLLFTGFYSFWAMVLFCSKWWLMLPIWITFGYIARFSLLCSLPFFLMVSPEQTVKILVSKQLLTWNTNIFLAGLSLVSTDSDLFKFTVEPQSQIVVRDQPLTFNCAARFSDSTPSISWLRYGEEIFGDDAGRRSVLPNGSLQFSSVVHTRSHRPDEGVYQCKATIPEVGVIVSRKATLKVTCKSFASNLESWKD